MSGDLFMEEAVGATPEMAFVVACQNDLKSNGEDHCTIASKTFQKDLKPKFIVINEPWMAMAPDEIIEDYIESCHYEKKYPAINDKWGPAGCIPRGGDKYLFFGISP